MTKYTHTLTELEAACGVTLEAVAHELPRGAFIDEGRAFIIDVKVGPALAKSTARAAFGGPARYAGTNTFGQHVYRAN